MLKKLLFAVFVLILTSNSLISQQKTDVWDFGAKQLDANLYNNKLSESMINSFYSVAAGTTNVPLPSSFSADILTWTGGSNDRLRTSNLNLTRYDTNLGAGSAAGYTGRLYVNAAPTSARILTLALNEDDEVSVFANSDGPGILNFVNVSNPTSQTNQIAITTTTTEYKFVAKTAGNYKIFDAVSKPSYYRIQRKAAALVTVTGSVDTSNASTITEGYSIIYTNAAGKSYSAVVSGGNYSITVPSGYNYSLSLGNANGYVITNGDTLNVTSNTALHDIIVAKVDLYSVTGSITGLGTNISNLALVYTPNPSANTIYVPKPIINKSAGTYSVNLEANIQYTISGTGVNDFEILANTLTIPASNTSSDIIFSPKPKYSVTIIAPDLNSTQLSGLNLTFTNVNESGYVYNFNNVNAISLRNGSYSVTSGGLDLYPLQQDLTAYLKVNGSNTSKNLTFLPVTNWSFEDKVITTATPNYKGLTFTGNIANEVAKGHIVCQNSATITIPVNPGEKLTISYYYAANFSINGNPAITTNSGSTSILENTEYVYTGTSAGNVVISVAGLTYIAEINKNAIAPYSPIITVGSGKNYPTINEALSAISSMVRNPTERVTVMIDPGTYEEMIVIKNPNITLKNASTTPSIDLANKGVDISPNAVRITSYYGVGYNYFSQGTDNKWNAKALEVNKANGFTNYNNVSGTTNSSYWNATAVILANNFEAEDIIFENSYNQYISKKESEDVIILVAGNKGLRPTSIGDVGVQNKSFVERAAAIGVANGVDKVYLKNCRVVGRQDSFFGGTNARVAVYKGVMMGAVDYIFGGMTAVFYQSKFAMNTSDVSSDASYLTAPQQTSGRGYLLYECTIGSAIPEIETASTYRAKPGYFGRPWATNTSETVMYKTTVETSNYPGSVGVSLISPAGWLSTLNGTSDKIYEYQTTELSGIDNSANRASWSKVLTNPLLTDGTAITPFNFTKGNDNWDPFNTATLTTTNDYLKSSVHIFSSKNSIYIRNIKAKSEIKVYGMNGAITKTLTTTSDINFELPTGIYLVTIQSNDGIKSVKILSK